MQLYSYYSWIAFILVFFWQLYCKIAFYGDVSLRNYSVNFALTYALL